MKRERLPLKMFVLTFVLFFGISFMLSGFTNRYTGAYLTDSETSEGNVFQAGTWDTSPQSEDLKIDLNDAELHPPNGAKKYQRLHKIFLNNSGSDDITIDEFHIEWNNPGSNITWVHLVGKPNMSINQQSPAHLDVDWVLSPDEEKHLKLRFNSNMKGTHFNLSFKMEDGSGEDYEVIPDNPINITQGPTSTIQLVKWDYGSIILHQIFGQVDVSSMEGTYVTGAEFFLNEKGENGEGYQMELVDNHSESTEITWEDSEGLICEEPCTIYLHGKDSNGKWGEFDSTTISLNESEENETSDGGGTSSDSTTIENETDSNNVTNTSSSIDSDTNTTSDSDEITEDFNDTYTNETENQTSTNTTYLENSIMSNTTENTTTNSTISINETTDENTTVETDVNVTENTTDNTTIMDENNTYTNDSSSDNESVEENTTIEVNDTEINETTDEENLNETTVNTTDSETSTDSTEEDNTTETYNETDIIEDTTNDDNENNTTGSNTTEYNQTDGDETS
ncbi:MAG: hypothetical protein ABEK36_01815 [Candidatus Aenigmatarchaeota archaeon]